MLIPEQSNTTRGAENPGVRPSLLEELSQRLQRAGALTAEGIVRTRRRFVGFWVCSFLAANFLMFLRFFFPRVIYEPVTKFKVGTLSDFSPGVDTRFLNNHRVWVVRTTDRVFVIFARCTHLGCTPNWMDSEQKFKCPCHGSGYDSEGLNFEGPAPRPMDRAKVQLDAEGQIVVDTAVLFRRERGNRDHFNDPGSYLPA